MQMQEVYVREGLDCEIQHSGAGYLWWCSLGLFQNLLIRINAPLQILQQFNEMIPHDMLIILCINNEMIPHDMLIILCIKIMTRSIQYQQ